MRHTIYWRDCSSDLCSSYLAVRGVVLHPRHRGDVDFVELLPAEDDAGDLHHRFFFSSRRRHTRCYRDWSSDVCSSDLTVLASATMPAWVTRMIDKHTRDHAEVRVETEKEADLEHGLLRVHRDLKLQTLSRVLKR